MTHNNVAPLKERIRAVLKVGVDKRVSYDEARDYVLKLRHLIKLARSSFGRRRNPELKMLRDLLRDRISKIQHRHKSLMS